MYIVLLDIGNITHALCRIVLTYVHLSDAWYALNTTT